MKFAGVPEASGLSPTEVALIDELYACHRGNTEWELTYCTHVLPESSDPKGTFVPISIERILRAAGVSAAQMSGIAEAADADWQMDQLLAAGFIFTVHFFNTHFRLEKFPMDTVIVSGRVSKAELLHERKRWSNRLQTTGGLEGIRVRDEWERWKGIARSFGYLFFGTGILLLILIVYAMIKRLTHGG